jgi:type IV pilus assembly protein PilP
MKKSPDILRILFCLTAALFLWAGCEDPAKTVAQPQEVRKKVTGQVAAGQRVAVPPVAAPLPSPAVPPAPTQTAQQTPASPPPSAPEPAPKPQLPPPPTTRPPQDVAVSTGGLPTPVSAAGPAAAVPDSQVATLLNIQVPALYNPKGKVDPFEPLLKEESAAAAVKVRVKTDLNRPKTPLEKLDLGQLKLVAIIAAPTGNRALVEESSGKGYIIKAGTYIGLNSGKVVNIADGKVLVEEEFEDVYGKAIIQKKEITLPKPPGEL